MVTRPTSFKLYDDDDDDDDNVGDYCTLRFLNRALRYTYIIRTNKMHTFYINVLI